MNKNRLNNQLAQQVMGWGLAPNRYLLGDRRWLPSWRFRPTENLEDAFQLLDAANPAEYLIRARRGTVARVTVKIGDSMGEAEHRVIAQAITYAVARACGIEPDLIAAGDAQ